jgi:hypothetical protein
MLVITEADAAAIRTTFDQEGELAAAIELRRRFPGIADNTKARAAGLNSLLGTARSRTGADQFAAAKQGLRP